MHNSRPLIDLAKLSSCTELTSEHAKQAASSAAEIRALLKRVAEIATPGDGCPKVLMAIARLVGQPWIEGDLRVELSGDDVATTINVMCDHGFGIRERLLPLARFSVPIDEFERALELAPKLVLPLRISDEEGKMVLTPLLTPESSVRSMAPAKLELDDASLGEGERKTAPPPADELQVIDEASPEDLLLMHAANNGDAEEANDTSATSTTPPTAGADDALEEARMDSGPVPTANNPDAQSAPRQYGSPGANDGRISSVHTRPTVRRMVAVDAAAIAALKRRDPRREEE